MFLDSHVTRDSFWQSHLGEMRKIRDLDDTHIINLIQYVQQYPMYYGPQFLEIFQAEAKLRNLEDKMQERSQIPYQDQHGQWWIWNFEKGHPEIVGRRHEHTAKVEEPKPGPRRTFLQKLFGRGKSS